MTVLDAECALADAWATGLSVLGPDAGYELAVREGVAALFVMQSPDGLRSRATPAFLGREAAYTEVEDR